MLAKSKKANVVLNAAAEPRDWKGRFPSVPRGLPAFDTFTHGRFFFFFFPCYENFPRHRKVSCFRTV
jgi:hypothetical protein